MTRRTVLHESELAQIHIGDRVVDLVSKTVSGRRAADPTEWHLLEILLRNPGKLVSQRQLLTEVWGEKYLKETHYLRQYMAQMRRSWSGTRPTRFTC